MDLKSIFSFNSQEQQREQSCFPNLSWNERLIGFAICCALGYLVQFLSFGAFLSLATGNPAKFAIIFSFGNILALAAYLMRENRTGFLLGFKRQFQNMVDPERRICSLIFVSALCGTLISALVFNSKLLVLLCLVFQIPSYIWYCASYIPFGRDCIKSCLSGLTNRFR